MGEGAREWVLSTEGYCRLLPLLPSRAPKTQAMTQYIETLGAMATSVSSANASVGGGDYPMVYGLETIPWMMQTGSQNGALQHCLACRRPMSLEVIYEVITSLPHGRHVI